MQILETILPQLTMTAEQKTTVEAGKDINGEIYIMIPSDVTTVDLEAIASTLIGRSYRLTIILRHYIIMFIRNFTINRIKNTD